MSDYNNRTISITQEDIHSEGHGCRDCPVHRGICRELSLDSREVWVGSSGISIKGEEYFTPLEVGRYDHGKGMEPFTFKLRRT
jgi:hypothetical protein